MINSNDIDIYSLYVISLLKIKDLLIKNTADVIVEYDNWRDKRL